MTSLADFLAQEGALPERPPTKQGRSHPKGWEPGVAWDGVQGTLTTEPLVTPPDWNALLQVWDLDPAKYEIEGSPQYRAWDGIVKNKEGFSETKRLYYYKATIRERRKTATDDPDLYALFNKPRRSKLLTTNVSTMRALVVCLTDWQIGKGENGGTEATVKRLLEAIWLVEDEITQQHKNHTPYDQVVLACMGDLIESCSGHYAMQEFQTDLDRRSQERVVRRVLGEYVRRISRKCPRVVVAAVPGNHGESRQNGKANTTWSDNSDLAVVEGVAEAVKDRPGFEHVSFVIADKLTLTLDVCGVIIGLAHGHAGRVTDASKLSKWWGANALSKQPIGDAQILFTGHYHHLKIDESTGRTWIQAPAMDNGSEWWTESSGQHSSSGLLLVDVGIAYGKRGWQNVRIL
jgi:predicted phosphodiesterase